MAAAPLSLPSQPPLQTNTNNNNYHHSRTPSGNDSIVGVGGGSSRTPDTIITVVTLNAWGIPHVSKDRRKRFKAIAELLVKNADQWDIVCLQEVWSENDFRMLVQATRECYPSSYHFYSGVMGSGVCVFTRGRIVATLMQRFSLNGYAYKIQHGDWFGGKICGLTKIVHKGLLINLYCTHTHATYSEGKNDEYKSHRIVQCFEISQFIRFTSTPTTLSLAKGIEHSTLPVSLPQLAAVVAANRAGSQTLPAVSTQQQKLVEQQRELQMQLDELHRQLTSSLSVNAPHTERDGAGAGTDGGDPIYSTIDWLHPITIVAGDFNMEGYDLGCQLVRRLAGVQDTWENYIRHAKLDPEDENNLDASTSETYDNYYTPKSVKRKRGLHCGKRIDYIFFCQPSGLASPYHIHCTKAAASINKIPTSADGKCYSDHKGYVATLCVRRKPISAAIAASRRQIRQRLLARQFRSPSTNVAYDPTTSTRAYSKGATPTEIFNQLHRFFPAVAHHHYSSENGVDPLQRSRSTVDWRRSLSNEVEVESSVSVTNAVVNSNVDPRHEQHHLKTVAKYSVDPLNDYELDDDHHNLYANGKLRRGNANTASHPQVRATQRSIIHDLTGRNEELLEQAIDIVESGFRRVHRNARKFVAVGILAFILFFATFALDSVFRLHIVLVITVAISRVLFIIVMFVCLWLTVVMTRIERNALLAARNTMLLMKGECNPDTLNIDMSSSSSESEDDLDDDDVGTSGGRSEKQPPDKNGVAGSAAKSAEQNGNIVHTVDETIVDEPGDDFQRQLSNKLKRSMRRSARMSKRRGGIVADRSQRESVVLNPSGLLVQMKRNDRSDHNTVAPPAATEPDENEEITPPPTNDVTQDEQFTSSPPESLSKRKRSKVKIRGENYANASVFHANAADQQVGPVSDDRRKKSSATRGQVHELDQLHYHTEGDQLDDDEVTIRGSLRRKSSLARQKQAYAASVSTDSSSSSLDLPSTTVTEHLRRNSGRGRSPPQQIVTVQPENVAVAVPPRLPRLLRQQPESHQIVARRPLAASFSAEADDESTTPSSTPTEELASSYFPANPLSIRRSVDDEAAEIQAGVKK